MKHPPFFCEVMVAVLVDSWPVVSVDKTGRVVVPCCGAFCTVDIFVCGGGVWERCVGV